MQSADRALAIMSSFRDERTTVGVSELAGELGVHKSTVSRLLATLEQRGFVRREADRFAPGLEVLRIAQLADADEALAGVAGEALSQLAEVTGEAATIGVRRGDTALYVRQYGGSHILGLAGDWTGRSTALHASATGKTLLAFGARPFEGPLEPFTARTIVDSAAFERELRRTRSRGYGVMRDELEDGLAAVAAPVFDRGGRCLAAVAVTGPTFRLSRSLDVLGQQCVSAAREITQLVGVRKTA